MGGAGMIWLTWRQHRKQLLVTTGAMAVLAAVLLPTGLSMRHTVTRLGLDACAGPVPAAGCGARIDEFLNTYAVMALVSILLLVIPPLVGVFWGAPLIAREVEQGTHRLVWTQGVSRRRWALVKLGLIGAAVTLFAAAYGLGVGWWYEPLSGIDEARSRFAWLFFDIQGVAPIGYTVFAVALGAAFGTILPRVLPAMAATLAAFIGARLAVMFLARPRYLPPEAVHSSIYGKLGWNDGGGDWVLAKEVHQADGTVVTSGLLRCPPPGEGPVCTAETELGLRPGAYNYELIHPADRFWAFQWIETGVFLLLAALLVWWTVRRLRRVA
jgi:hypothetical protein